MADQPKRKSSGVRMRASGRKPVQFWLTHDDLSQVQRAAFAQGLSVAEFCRHNSRAAAGLPPEKSSTKSSDSS